MINASQPVDIPGLGLQLMGWRLHRKQELDDWADLIFGAGFQNWGDANDPGNVCDRATLARALERLEQWDSWTLGDFVGEVAGFLDAMLTGLVHGADDRTKFNVVAKICVRRMLELL